MKLALDVGDIDGKRGNIGLRLLENLRQRFLRANGLFGFRAHLHQFGEIFAQRRGRVAFPCVGELLDL
ncbi:hypothetical protein D3C87_2052290 [compost metagenome]